MAPSLLFFKRIYAECTSEKTPNRIREPAFFKSDGTPIQKTRFFDQLESRLKMKPKNVIFLGENHLDPNSHLLELEILKATFSHKQCQFHCLSPALGNHLMFNHPIFW